ncbi:LpqB family beta-propeller domain-containing protein [Boudabousia marimammalium]|uniref:GerMN domain-containing protein n=1 Tax=Boudabousia marimammalium TaxID=156892 RepID=A0A1Q5PRS4_9ACTO|nr:LpqB family beta-propeller domain-containing protein [Boudabousia marimammalium]OKL50199.1 hypothetical protein BM477_02055 [Boudabousia marimammalium]
MRTQRPSRRKSFALVITLVGTLLLSACGSLPSSGSVHVSEGDLPPEGRSMQTAPLPRKGSSQLDIMRGFMAACSAGATNNDFEAARQYLLSTARRGWEPERSIRIYGNDQVPEIGFSETQEKAQLTIAATGQVDASGQFQVGSPGGKLVGTFSFAQDEEGEWRISELPAGITISQGTFDASYQRLPIYYLSPDKTILVPDLRWVPKSKTVTYLTQHLLDGPSADLGSSVATALPAGTSLPSRTVAVENGQALVNLQVPDATPPDEAQSLLQWQISATLSQLPSVTSVKVTLNDNLVTVSPPAGPAYSGTEVLVVSDNNLRTLSGDTVLLSADKAGDLEISSPARGPIKGSPVAFVNAERELWTISENQSPRQLLSAEYVGAPSIDYANWIWVPTKQSGAVTAVRASGESVRVPVSYTTDQLLSFVVSPAGVHAIATRGGDTRAADLVRINRDDRGVPVSVDLIASVPLPHDSLILPAWTSATAAAILLRSEASGEASILSWPLGGLRSQEPAYPKSRAFVAAIGARRLYVVTDDNVLFQLDGRHWIPVGRNVSAVATSG